MTWKVIGAAIEVHKHLGPGMLESAYEKCLYYELEKLDFEVQRQLYLPLFYKELYLDHAYRIDLLVNDELIIELKTVTGFTPVDEAQILTYMKFAKKPKGLLINFKTSRLKDGIRRFVI